MNTYCDQVEVIDRASAFAFVQEHHYSAVLPRLTKLTIGGYRDGQLSAVVTFGWGVRPLHTIAKAFPGLTPADYYEVGKMCLGDWMPRNSESHFLRRALRLLKELRPQLQIVWTWADGILGKPGYVYQAANFFYGGFIWTEMYLDAAGIRVHPRSVQGFTTQGKRDRETTEGLGLQKYWGKQFRYCYPLCSNHRWQTLSATSPFDWRRRDYPKGADLEWKGPDRESCAAPPYTAGRYVKPTPQLALG